MCVCVGQKVHHRGVRSPLDTGWCCSKQSVKLSTQDPEIVQNCVSELVVQVMLSKCCVRSDVFEVMCSKFVSEVVFRGLLFGVVF